MKLKRFFIAAALLVMSATALMAQELPPIPKDDKVRIGKLDNGLTYYIRNNNWPENKANFYIAQRVGSIQENDDQRGLAHFLEHMAFNGSEHFPDSTLLEYTRSLGVEFGSDLNAYTSIDQTVYRISNVPTKRAAAIDSCILILKDWSNGLTLDSKEIDKEAVLFIRSGSSTRDLASACTRRFCQHSILAVSTASACLSVLWKSLTTSNPTCSAHTTASGIAQTTRQSSLSAMLTSTM